MSKSLLSNNNSATGENDGIANYYVIGADGTDVGVFNSAGAALYYDNVCENISSNALPPICDVPTVTILNPTPGSSDRFGISVDIDKANNHIIIGAENDSTNGQFAGAAYLYDTSGTLLQTYLNPTPGSAELFGSSVSVQDGIVVIGARQDNANADDSGVVYVYDTSGNLQTVILNPAPALNDRFGNAVHFRNQLLVIGALRDDGGAIDTGAAYLVDFNTPPTALGDSKATFEGVSIIISPLDNDFDPDVGDILSIGSFDLTSTRGGTVSPGVIDPDTVIYTPPPDVMSTTLLSNPAISSPITVTSTVELSENPLSSVMVTTNVSIIGVTITCPVIHG